MIIQESLVLEPKYLPYKGCKRPQNFCHQASDLLERLEGPYPVRCTFWTDSTDTGFSVPLWSHSHLLPHKCRPACSALSSWRSPCNCISKFVKITNDQNNTFQNTTFIWFISLKGYLLSNPDNYCILKYGFSICFSRRIKTQSDYWIRLEIGLINMVALRCSRKYWDWILS